MALASTMEQTAWIQRAPCSVLTHRREKQNRMNAEHANRWLLFATTWIWCNLWTKRMLEHEGADSVWYNIVLHQWTPLSTFYAIPAQLILYSYFSHLHTFIVRMVVCFCLLILVIFHRCISSVEEVSGGLPSFVWK